MTSTFNYNLREKIKENVCWLEDHELLSGGMTSN